MRQAANHVEENENKTDLESSNDSNDNTQQIEMNANKGTNSTVLKQHPKGFTTRHRSTMGANSTNLKYLPTLSEPVTRQKTHIQLVTTSQKPN